jgi:hypothetical protein
MVNSEDQAMTLIIALGRGLPRLVLLHSGLFSEYEKGYAFGLFSALVGPNSE